MPNEIYTNFDLPFYHIKKSGEIKDPRKKSSPEN